MPEPHLVQIRANRLIATWGRRTAVGMAQRYLREAERCGNPAAVQMHSAVLDEVVFLTARAA